MAQWKVLGTHERTAKKVTEVVAALRCNDRLDLVVLGCSPMSEDEVQAALAEAIDLRSQPVAS